MCVSVPYRNIPCLVGETSECSTVHVPCIGMAIPSLDGMPARPLMAQCSLNCVVLIHSLTTIPSLGCVNVHEVMQLHCGNSSTRRALHGFSRSLIVSWSDSTSILRWCQHSAEVIHIMIMIVHLPIFHWQTPELFVVIYRYMPQFSGDECYRVVTFVCRSLIMRKHVWFGEVGGL